MEESIQGCRDDSVNFIVAVFKGSLELFAVIPDIVDDIIWC